MDCRNCPISIILGSVNYFLLYHKYKMLGAGNHCWCTGTRQRYPAMKRIPTSFVEERLYQKFINFCRNSPALPYQFILASLWLNTRMALSEDLDTLCTQQLFRAAESSHLEELDDFDLVLSQTSNAELSAFCTQGPALSLRDRGKILLEALPQPQLLSSTHKERRL